MTAGPELLTNLTPRVDPEAVKAALGGPEAVPADMRPRLDDLLNQVVEAADPRGCLLELDITAWAEERVELGAAALTGLGVAGLLKGSHRAAAITVSLGPGPEALMRAATDEGRLVDLTLLDAVASEAVEALADQAQEEVERRGADQGRASTRRYSPGYCDWDLEQQAAFAGWGLFEPAGIQLTPEYLMLPEKSVSAIMGLGPPGSRGSRLGRPPACKHCPRRADCPGP